MTKQREPQTGEAVGPRLELPVGRLAPERAAPPPLNGSKTHPLTRHGVAMLVELSHGPVPAGKFNPGVINRLLRGELAEIVMLPSPYKTHHGKRIEHLQLTRTGHDAAMESHKPHNAKLTGPSEAKGCNDEHRRHESSPSRVRVQRPVRPAGG